MDGGGAEAARWDRMAEVLARLYMRPGYPFEHDDPAVHRIQLRWLLGTGQWVLIGSGKLLLGWQSWFRCDHGSLQTLSLVPFAEIIRQQIPLTLTEGPCCYIAATVVAPWAPPQTYRRLRAATMARNQDAECFAAHLFKRDGRIKFAVLQQPGVGHVNRNHQQQQQQPPAQTGRGAAVLQPDQRQ